MEKIHTFHTITLNPEKQRTGKIIFQKLTLLSLGVHATPFLAILHPIWYPCNARSSPKPHFYDFEQKFDKYLIFGFFYNQNFKITQDKSKTHLYIQKEKKQF